MHRHQYKGRKLSRESGPRKALIRNLVSQLILHEKITTTYEKAKEIQPVAEKMITNAKKGTLAARRNVTKFLSQNDRAVEKLFNEFGPLFSERPGGYTRIVKLGNRQGDNAKIAQIQILDTEKLTKKEIEAKKPTTSKKEDKKDTPKKAVKKPQSSKSTKEKDTKEKK